MMRSNHEVVTMRKVSIPSFLSWPPSIAQTLSHWIMRYIVQDGFKDVDKYKTTFKLVINWTNVIL